METRNLVHLSIKLWVVILIFFEFLENGKPFQIPFRIYIKSKLVAIIDHSLNPLSANPEKWSNTLKQIVGNLPTICLSVFDHFMDLALKGLKEGHAFAYTLLKIQLFYSLIIMCKFV